MENKHKNLIFPLAFLLSSGAVRSEKLFLKHKTIYKYL